MDQLIPPLPAWIALAGFLAAAFSAAATGALFKPGAWYRTLAKPAWTPPDWLFPIAWTALYAAMALAAWWVSLHDAPMAAAGLALWAWQIVLNALWSPIVFGLRRLAAGFVVIVLLWVAVAATAWAFAEVSAAAGWLMAPYLVWVTYAAALNLAVWRMNPGAGRAPA